MLMLTLISYACFNFFLILILTGAIEFVMLNGLIAFFREHQELTFLGVKVGPSTLHQSHMHNLDDSYCKELTDHINTTSKESIQFIHLSKISHRGFYGVQ